MGVVKFVSLVLTLVLCVTLATADFNLDDIRGGSPFDPRSFPPNNVILCDLNPNLPFPVPQFLFRNTTGDPISLNTGTVPDTTEPPPFKPLVSPFGFPSSIENLGFLNIAELLNLLQNDIIAEQQPISDPVLAGLEVPDNPCNVTVRESLSDTNQMNASEIASLIERRINETGGITVTDDPIDAVRRIYQGLNCYVRSEWVDAGPSFFPRYFAGTSCVRRNCAIPDGAGMHCQPDLSSEEVQRITALRWDCCFALQTLNMGDGRMNVFRRRQFQCGWRKVTFPLVCDCDCVCDE